MRSEVVAKLPHLSVTFRTISGVPHNVLRDDVVVVQEAVVPGRRLAVDQAPGLDRAFLRVALPLEHDPVLARPAWRFAPRISPEHIGIGLFQSLVALELLLYLHQEPWAIGPGAAEDAYRDFGITDNLLDQANERRDPGL